MDATACRWTASSVRYFTEHGWPVRRNRGWARARGKARSWARAGAETGTVQGCSRFVNLSIERLDHFSSHFARLMEIGEVALCTNEPACCSLLGVHNPIGVWCNPVIEIMSGDY